MVTLLLVARLMALGSVYTGAMADKNVNPFHQIFNALDNEGSGRVWYDNLEYVQSKDFLAVIQNFQKDACTQNHFLDAQVKAANAEELQGAFYMALMYEYIRRDYP